MVDDNEGMLNRAAMVLSGECTIVGAVKDGPAALEIADSLHPDVIVLDISMPGMSGLEVAAALKASGSSSAVVFLTAHDDEEFVEAAKAMGALGYVIKPRLASHLVRAVLDARAGISSLQS